MSGDVSEGSDGGEHVCPQVLSLAEPVMFGWNL